MRTLLIKSLVGSSLLLFGQAPRRRCPGTSHRKISHIAKAISIMARRCFTKCGATWIKRRITSMVKARMCLRSTEPGAN